MTFNKEVELNMNADLRTKVFKSNYAEKLGKNILKTAAIFGPNNTGKSNFINSVSDFKNIISNTYIGNTNFLPNFQTKRSIIEWKVQFIYENNLCDYCVSLNYESKTFVQESFFYKNEKGKYGYSRNIKNKEFSCETDKDLEKAMEIASDNNILIYSIQLDNSELLNNAKKIIAGFAKSIEVIDTNTISFNKTLSFANYGAKSRTKILDFMKKTDLYFDDYIYDERKIDFIDENDEEESDSFKFMSVYNGMKMPSVLFDSLGTNKLLRMSGYILDAIENNKTIFIDELDSSLHFVLVKAIISLFNNIKNEESQLIFTSHDISLMDCKNMFRKEQLWFTNKYKKVAYLTCLSDFKAENGVRQCTDILSLYEKGFLTSIPDPKLIEWLIDVKEEK